VNPFRRPPLGGAVAHSRQRTWEQDPLYPTNVTFRLTDVTILVTLHLREGYEMARSQRLCVFDHTKSFF